MERTQHAAVPLWLRIVLLDLHLSEPQSRQENSATGPELNVTAEVTNTGSVAADEVDQRAGRSSRPVRELKGFERVHLKPRENRTIHFKLGPQELRYWSATDQGWSEDAAVFDVWVGADSVASLHGSFTRVAAK